MKILMVCLGNICRSPLAHGILQDEIQKRNLDWEVDSCGTSSFHNGELPDQRSIDVAMTNGIDISYQRSRQISVKDLEYFDKLIAMDSSNFNDISRLAHSQLQRDKVELLLNYSSPGMNKAVPDPYYHGRFQEVYEMIDEAVQKIIELYK